MNKTIKHLPNDFEVDLSKELDYIEKEYAKDREEMNRSLTESTQLFTLNLFVMYLKGMNDPFKILTTSEIEQQKDKFINEILKG